MLSKSAAKTFVQLTVGTVGQLDERSHFEKCSTAAKTGYKIYLSNNCMGCHTLMGKGPYYAPGLTLGGVTRGEEKIKTFGGHRLPRHFKELHETLVEVYKKSS